MTLKEAEKAREVLEADGCLEVFVGPTSSGDYLVKADGVTYWDIEELDEDERGLEPIWEQTWDNAGGL
jgi:hypothetical protein